MLRRLLVFAVIVVLYGFSAGSAADRQFTPEQIRSFGFLPKGTEIPQLEDACSQHFSNGDGTITARIVAGGRRAQDSSALDNVSTIVGFHSGFSELTDIFNSDYVDQLTFIASGMDLSLYNLREAGWEEWPTTSIPSGSTVTAICCSLRFFPSTSGYPAPSQVPIYDMGPTEPSSYQNDPNGHYTDATTGNNYGSFTGMGTSQVWVWTMLNPQARTDLQGALSRGWWGIGIAPYGDYEEAEFRNHRFSTVSQRPRLIVTYTPPGGAPDISVQRFLAPPASVDSGVAQTVKATIKNVGTVEATGINAGFKISGTVPYNSGRTGISLGVGESTDVTFDSWVPARCGTFTTRCTVQVAGDVNRMNDTLNGSVSVQYRDVGCTQILQPAGTIDSGAPIAPRVQVRNYGTDFASFVVACSLGTYSNTQTADEVPAGSEVSITFPLPYWQPRRGTFGVKFYTIFTTDMNHTNDTIRGTVTVNVADVGCDRVLAPVSDLDSVAALSPVAKVKNYGNVNVTAPFNVLFSIGSWSGTKQVASLNAGDSVTLTFDTPSWGCPRGPYAGKCSTQMSGDLNRGDDAKTTIGFVRVSDVGCDRILAPVGDFDSAGLVSPQANVKNYGNTDVSSPFDVVFTIDGWSSTRSVTNLNAGDSAILTFDSPAPWNCPRGPYSARCSTKLAADRVPDNNLKTASGAVSVRDVGATAVITPSGNVDAGVPVTPQVRAQNFGTADEVCDLRLLVVSAAQETLYDHTETGVLVLVSGPVVEDFAVQWTPGARGLCSTKAFTVFAGDANHVNDSARGSCTVLSPVVHDVSCVAIVAPVNSVDTLPKVPQARVKNSGEAVETFVAWFRILDRSSVQVYYDSARATGLAPSSEAVLSYPTWSGHHASGDYTTKCSTALAGDAHPENDARDGSFRVGSLGPALWNRMTDLPTGGRRKNVKDGACLAAATEDGSDTAFVYAFKGNNTFEFYRYNTATNSWIARESIPAYNRLMKKKGVKKGASLVQAGNGRLYAAKGNGTYDWWEYLPGVGGQGSGVWLQKPDVPTGSKRVKEGTGAVAVAEGGVDYVYLLKGSGTFEFYRYNSNTDVWDTSLPSAPSGASGKMFKNGSCLTYDGGDTIYALKGSYNEFFAYSISARTWATRETLPRICPPGTSKKKVKDGAGIAVVGRALYALKGGNTNEFWMYARDDRRWSPAAQMPTVTKKVKGGGALTYASGALALYAFRGNNTLEFWSYGPLAADGTQLPALGSPKDVQGKSSVRGPQFALRITPNPFSQSLNPSISYSLPVSGNVSLRLYDLSGKLVGTLAEGFRSAGSYSHSLLTAHHSFACGVYLLRLESEGGRITEKLIIE